jgi:hypothetical protein
MDHPWSILVTCECATLLTTVPARRGALVFPPAAGRDGGADAKQRKDEFSVREFPPNHQIDHITVAGAEVPPGSWAANVMQSLPYHGVPSNGALTVCRRKDIFAAAQKTFYEPLNLKFSIFPVRGFGSDRRGRDADW